MCFIYSILAALYPMKTNPQRVSKYLPYLDAIDISDLTFPVTIDQVPVFENKNNLSINVLEYSHDRVKPLHCSDNKSETIINLLLLHSKDGESSHYCLIRDMSRLLRTQITGYQHKVFFCYYCLNYYHTIEKLNKHKLSCKEINSQLIEFPLPNTRESKLEYSCYEKQLPFPFVIYADFECITEEVSNDNSATKSKEEKYQKHIPYSYGYKVVCHENKELSRDLYTYLDQIL